MLPYRGRNPHRGRTIPAMPVPHVEHQRRYRKRLRHMARRLFGFKCNTCGSKSRKLHFAHLEPTGLNGMGRGSVERYKDVLRNPTAYTLECRTCHYLRDNGGDIGDF